MRNYIIFLKIVSNSSIIFFMLFIGNEFIKQDKNLNKINQLEEDLISYMLKDAPDLQRSVDYRCNEINSFLEEKKVKNVTLNCENARERKNEIFYLVKGIKSEFNEAMFSRITKLILFFIFCYTIIQILIGFFKS